MHIIVGQPIKGWPPFTEGTRFQPATFGQPMVLIGLPDPTEAEIRAVQQDPIKLGLYRADDHTAFLLMHMPGLHALDGWGDAPFSAMMESPETRRLPPREPNAGWAFTFILVNTRNQCVAALRVGSVTPEFSTQLEELLSEHVVKAPSFSVENHNNTIQHTYARFPSPRRMVHRADIVEPFGAKFSDARAQRTGTLYPPTAPTV